MIFRKSKKTVKNGASGMDKLVTGIIIWGAAASIFWLSRTKKWQKLTQTVYSQSGGIFKRGLSMFGKFTVNILSFFQKK